MNKLARKGLVSAMVAGGVLASAGYAQADAAAEGDATGSPGVLSGNSLQIPVHVPVNVCGNTINVIGLLNSAAGNACANISVSGAGASARSSANSWRMKRCCASVSQYTSKENWARVRKRSIAVRRSSSLAWRPTAVNIRRRVLR